MMRSKRAVGIVAALTVGLLSGGLAFGQSAGGQRAFPSKPVRLVVGFAPGGGTDILGRLIAARMTVSLVEQVVVENRPGANGNLAAEVVAKTAPDGHTLLIMSVQYAIGKSVYRKLGYDLERDFTGVADIALVPQVLVVHPSLPVKTAKELAGLARARPGQLVYGSSGSGSVEHMAGAMFANAAKIDMIHVPYKGGAPAAIDLVAGQIQLVFNTVPVVINYIKDSRVRALAATTESRIAVLPDVPTMAESGYPGYSMSVWYGILAPAGTPATIVEQLHGEIVKALDHPEVREKFLALGAAPLGKTSPAAFTTHLRNEVARFAKIARDNNIQVD